jgi:hypothetical protein
MKTTRFGQGSRQGEYFINLQAENTTHFNSISTIDMDHQPIYNDNTEPDANLYRCHLFLILYFFKI